MPVTSELTLPEYNLTHQEGSGFRVKAKPWGRAVALVLVKVKGVL